MPGTSRIYRSAGIAVRQDGDAVVVAPGAEADLAAITHDASLRLALRVPVGGRLVIDLAKAGPTGGGSLAIAAALQLSRACSSRASVSVVNAPPVLAEGMRRMGLDRVVGISPGRASGSAPPAKD